MYLESMKVNHNTDVVMVCDEVRRLLPTCTWQRGPNVGAISQQSLHGINKTSVEGSGFICQIISEFDHEF